MPVACPLGNLREFPPDGTHMPLAGLSKPGRLGKHDTAPWLGCTGLCWRCPHLGSPTPGLSLGPASIQLQWVLLVAEAGLRAGIDPSLGMHSSFGSSGFVIPVVIPYPRGPQPPGSKRDLLLATGAPRSMPGCVHGPETSHGSAGLFGEGPGRADPCQAAGDPPLPRWPA